MEYDFFKAIKTLYKHGKFNLKEKSKKLFDSFDETIKDNNLILKRKSLLTLMRYYFNNNKITKIDIIT